MVDPQAVLLEALGRPLVMVLVDRHQGPVAAVPHPVTQEASVEEH